MARRSRRLKWPIIGAVVVVAAGAGTAYAVAGGTAAPNYRTVSAGTGDVDETLTLTGLVDVASRSDLSFGTGGTIAKIKVAQGEQIKLGQVIATLKTDDLDATVTEAEATLAKARAQLESDANSQTSSVQNAATTTKPSTGSSGSSSSGSAGQSSAATAALLRKLKAEQQAVIAAQSAASGALSAAAASLAAQTAACANAYQTPSAAPSATATATPTSSTADQNAACAAALADVQAKQEAVKQAQDALAAALNDLSGTLTSALGAGSSSGSPSSGSPTATHSSARTTATAATGASSQNNTGQNSTGGNGSASNSSANNSGTVTAARLASDQAQIDHGKADLITAQTARSQATLRSTRSGTVASLDVASGDSVISGTTVAVVLGGKALTLTGTIPEVSVGQVKLGQTARVVVPGSRSSTTGTVSAIGLTADNSSGSTTYPVTITVEDPTIALPTGSSAQVSIVLATVSNVVTLPISAIVRNGTTARVETWNGTTLSQTTVGLLAVGSRMVAISSGLTAGTKVVVADVDQAISGASSQLNQRGNFSGFGGGGNFTFRSRSGTGGGSGGGTGGAPTSISGG